MFSRPMDGSADEVLRLAASLEQGSEHPLADGIVANAKERKLQLSPASQVRAIAGKGVVGVVEGRTLAVGNRSLLADQRITAGELATRARRERGSNACVRRSGWRGHWIDFGVADPIKAIDCRDHPRYCIGRTFGS